MESTFGIIEEAQRIYKKQQAKIGVIRSHCLQRTGSVTREKYPLTHCV